MAALGNLLLLGHLRVPPTIADPAAITLFVALETAVAAYRRVVLDVFSRVLHRFNRRLAGHILILLALFHERNLLEGEVAKPMPLR
jgi:hypothetical protein